MDLRVEILLELLWIERRNNSLENDNAENNRKKQKHTIIYDRMDKWNYEDDRIIRKFENAEIMIYMTTINRKWINGFDVLRMMNTCFLLILINSNIWLYSQKNVTSMTIIFFLLHYHRQFNHRSDDMSRKWKWLISLILRVLFSLREA